MKGLPDLRKHCDAFSQYADFNRAALTQQALYIRLSVLCATIYGTNNLIS